MALAGGVLHINGIEGDKDLSTEAGDIAVVVNDQQIYRRVDVAVQTGSLAAPVFGQNSIASRSFAWTGKGLYQLRVRVGTGQVTLRD